MSILLPVKLKPCAKVKPSGGAAFGKDGRKLGRDFKIHLLASLEGSSDDWSKSKFRLALSSVMIKRPSSGAISV